ncbi:MAG: hypothetical protein M3Y91_15780 [Actinomycetota bacterium]|nr:hypothetical protein [Actinomycetota bacterium]
MVGEQMVGEQMVGEQMQDFSMAARAVLGIIQDRLDFEMSWVSRRQGDRYVILDCLGANAWCRRAT